MRGLLFILGVLALLLVAAMHFGLLAIGDADEAGAAGSRPAAAQGTAIADEAARISAEEPARNAE